MQHTSAKPYTVFCATLFTVHSSLQMSEAVSNAIQIWISAVLCKFDSNYVCITELWNKSVCCGMWIHIPLLFLSIIVFSVCWAFISCGLFLFFFCSPFLLFFFFKWDSFSKIKKKKKELRKEIILFFKPVLKSNINSSYRQTWSKKGRLYFILYNELALKWLKNKQTTTHNIFVSSLCTKQEVILSLYPHFMFWALLFHVPWHLFQ